MDPLHQALFTYYGYQSFRFGQEKIIQRILQGQDVLAVMPTGAGKSICYQLPGQLLEGITLVISPLIALMKDQVDMLRQNGMQAAVLNSSLDTKQYKETYAQLRAGQLKFLYVAPERLELAGFLALLGQLPISLIAVDEAHCISQWGHEFRPSYRNISALLRHLEKRPPIAAFTATATEEVKSDILEQLQLNDPFLVSTGFDRPNLTFEVLSVADKKSWLQQNLHPARPAIIYCASRKTVEEVHLFLERCHLPATRYHAGLSESERAHSHEQFLRDEKPLMVATIAFGMGIDKSNVRQVIHYNLSKSLENYYQEAGRCGRDGEPGTATLLFSPGDVMTQRYFIEQNGGQPQEYARLRAMEKYARSHRCLRQTLLGYFGEILEAPCQNCSACLCPKELRDVTEEARKILSCIYRMNGNYGLSLVVSVLRASNSKRVRALSFDGLSTYGLMKEYSSEQLRQLIEALVAEGCLEQTGDAYPVLSLNARSARILRLQEKIELWLEPAAMYKSSKPVFKGSSHASSLYPELFEKLRLWRYEQAKKEQTAPFIILSDATLRELCHHQPTTPAELLQVPGIGQVKASRYGPALLALLSDALP